MSRPLLQATAHRRLRWRSSRRAPAAMAAVDTDTYREFDQFMDVFNRVKADYVDKVDDKTLIKGAIDGMLAALDPHSSYVDALDFDNLRDPDRRAIMAASASPSRWRTARSRSIAPQEDTPGASARASSRATTSPISTAS